jgi:hypothetical protein
MKKTLLALMLAGSSLFAMPRIGIGINLGVPPARVAVVRPPCPGPGYVWVDGYYGPHGAWIAGYWTLPPAVGAAWIAPRYVGPRYVPGYWARAAHPRYFHPDRDGFRR